MKSVYNIDDFLPVKEDLAVVEQVNDLFKELGINKTITNNQINIAKDVILQKVKTGVDRIEELVKNKKEDRTDEIIQALGLMKTLSANQVELVKDAIVQKFKKGLDKIEGLVKEVNEKNYSPEIKNEINLNQAEVILAIEVMKTDVVKALVDLKTEIARKKKWEFKIVRDSYDLITSIIATEKN